MTSQTPFVDPQVVIGKRWRGDQAPEQTLLLSLARDTLRFMFATGQRYAFEDFLQNRQAGSPPARQRPPEGLADLAELMARVEGLFTRLRDEPDATDERALIQVIIDSLQFISASGQYSTLAEYLEHVRAGAPPYAVASFATRAEAEAWLRSHPNPPDSANILIADAYHDVVYDRETETRLLPRNSDLHYYLAELGQEQPPVATATFATLEEASAWLRAQPAPARWAWVQVGGEFYLAVYHPNLNHRALYPLSMADKYNIEPDTP
jgi:hypothetical protein